MSKKRLDYEGGNQTLISRIKEAFADVPYPGDENILSTPDHILICEECHDLYEIFKGIGRGETLEGKEWFNNLGYAITFFSAAGWQYFLPAYLIQSISHNKLGSLHFYIDSDPELVEYWEDRISQLNQEQFKVLVDYLSAVVELNDPFTLDRDVAALEQWKERYQAVALRDQHSLCEG